MYPVLAIGFGGPTDIAIIAVVVMLLFGGPKIAEFARSAGQGIKEFKKATAEDEPAPASAPTPVSTSSPTNPT